MADACATCASSYGNLLEPASEKPLFPGRDLDCCGRSICSRCLNQNKRYETYCPYCQITTQPSVLPQGLKDPPAYDSSGTTQPPSHRDLDADNDEPPSYEDTQKSRLTDTKESTPDVLHFLDPADTMLSVSLAYDIPIDILRKANNIYSDHLIRARRTIIIPGEYNPNGVSLSPRPPEGEEEEAKKHKVRRWMVACKVAEYDVALLYMQQAEWDLDAAVEAYREDERWEKEHPLEARRQGKKGKAARDVGMRRFVGGR